MWHEVAPEAKVLLRRQESLENLQTDCKLDRERRQSPKETWNTGRASNDHSAVHFIMNSKSNMFRVVQKCVRFTRMKKRQEATKRRSVNLKLQVFCTKQYPGFCVICALACCLCIPCVLLYNVAAFLLISLSTKWTQTSRTVEGIDARRSATMNWLISSSKHWYYTGFWWIDLSHYQSCHRCAGAPFSKTASVSAKPRSQSKRLPCKQERALLGNALWMSVLGAPHAANPHSAAATTWELPKLTGSMGVLRTLAAVCANGERGSCTECTQDDWLERTSVYMQPGSGLCSFVSSCLRSRSVLSPFLSRSVFRKWMCQLLWPISILSVALI